MKRQGFDLTSECTCLLSKYLNMYIKIWKKIIYYQKSIICPFFLAGNGRNWSFEMNPLYWNIYYAGNTEHTVWKLMGSWENQTYYLQTTTHVDLLFSWLCVEIMSEVFFRGGRRRFSMLPLLLALCMEYRYCNLNWFRFVLLVI